MIGGLSGEATGPLRAMSMRRNISNSQSMISEGCDRGGQSPDDRAPPG